MSLNTLGEVNRFLSLSEIVESYFKALTANAEGEKKEPLSPRVRKLRGILKVDKNFDSKSILEDALMKNIMDKIFVDTDVVINFLIDRQPHANHSSKIFDLLIKIKLKSIFQLCLLATFIM